MGWRWRRRKTVRGFGRTNAAAAAVAVLVVVTIRVWRDGGPALIVAACAAATVIASGLVIWAFRVEAEEAFGPPGSPERRRRRLTRAQLARSFGAGVLVAGAMGVVLLLVSRLDDSGPSAGGLVLFLLYFGPAYGAAFAWNAWAAVDEDAPPPELDGVPARSVPRPVAAPRRQRRVHVRRAMTVCVLLGALGVAAAVEGFVDGDGERAGVGLGLAAGSAGLLVWVATREEQ